MTKLTIWGLVAGGLVAAFLLLWVGQHCGGGTDAAWKQKLADTVLVLNNRNAATVAKNSADSAKHFADSTRADSASRAQTQQVVEALASRNVALAAAARAHSSTTAAEAALARLTNGPDSLRQRGVVIAALHVEVDSLHGVITTDSAAIGKLVADTVSLHVRLGVSQDEAVRQRLRADTTADRLGVLLRVAGQAPKGLNILGIHFNITIAPYLGAGVGYDLTTHTDSNGKPEARFRGPQIQLGISIARGN